MFKLGSSLAAKWFVLQIGLLGLILFVTGFYQYYSIRDAAYDDVQSSSDAISQTIRELTAEHSDIFDSDKLQPALYRLTVKIPNIRLITVRDAAHNIVAKADSNKDSIKPLLDEDVMRRLFDFGGETTSFYQNAEGNVLRSSYAIQGRYDPVRKSCIIGILTIDSGLAEVENNISAAFYRTMFLLSGLLFMFWVIQYFSARRGFLMRLYYLSDIAGRFGSGDFSARVAVRSKDELGQLAKGFNTMAAEVETSQKVLKDEISERRLIEEQLKAKQARLDEAQSIARIGNWEWKIPEDEVTWSDELYRIFGVQPQEFAGTYQAYLERVHPDDREIVASVVERAFNEGIFSEYGCRIVLPDGTIRFIHCNGYVTLDETGKPVKMVGTAQDVTERRRIEEALRESEQKLFRLMEAMPIAVFVVDANGRPYYSNKEAYWLLGISAMPDVELSEIGKVYNVYCAGSDVPYPDEKMPVRRALQGETAIIRDLEIHREDRVVPLEVSCAPIYDSEGKIVFGVAAFIDVTEQKRVEAELKMTRDAALESTRMKSEFLANMSHEIRTPMNGVIGMTGLLLDTDLDEEQRDYAKTINASADSLLTIINDILDFSKIEAGKLSFESLDFDLLTLVETTVEMLAERAENKGLELASLIAADVPTAVIGDPGRLRQVLLNLIGNAVKFTERGEVTVYVKKENETETHAQIRFELHDTGIGISEKQQENLFQAFVQADGSTTRKYGGTGLGLAISRQIVELMGGEIGIKSEPGKGSVFDFSVRLEKQQNVAQTASSHHSPEELKDVRVLIVDDNETNRRILKHQTASWGIVSDEAQTGRGALKKLRTAADRGEPFEIALLDFNMPDLDGMRLAKTIKSDPLISGTRLVLMPSYTSRGDGSAARELGVSGYLPKPVRKLQLYECLVALMGDATGSKSAGNVNKNLITKHSLNEERAAGRVSILIAEDNSINQKVTKKQVEKLGYRAHIVGDGKEALDALEKIPFDIVLMDCQMPEMDGYEATAEIRRREGKEKHTVIIALTANAMAGEAEKCLAAGMDGYLSKPVDIEELDLMLQKWQPENKIAKPVLRKTTGGKSAAPFNLNRLRAAAGDDEELMRELIQIFLSEMPANIEKLKEAARENRLDEIKRLTHKMTGGSATCGMVAVSDCLNQLAKIVNDTAKVNGESDLIAQVETEFKRTVEFLKNSTDLLPDG